MLKKSIGDYNQEIFFSEFAIGSCCHIYLRSQIFSRICRVITLYLSKFQFKTLHMKKVLFGKVWLPTFTYNTLHDETPSLQFFVIKFEKCRLNKVYKNENRFIRFYLVDSGHVSNVKLNWVCKTNKLFAYSCLKLKIIWMD